MDYSEIQGDLFSNIKEGAGYAHCIANDGRYGAGIAPVFIDKIFNIRDKVLEALASNPWTGKGKTVMIKASHDGVNVYTFNMVTKEMTWYKPTYSTVEEALKDIKYLMLDEGIKELRLPRIGCGIDGLDWEVVSDMIKTMFKDTNIIITVYVK